jgi:hypothetical protein
MLLDERLEELRGTIVDIDQLEQSWGTQTPAGARFVAGFGASMAKAAANYIESNRELLLKLASERTDRTVDQSATVENRP